MSEVTTCYKRTHSMVNTVSYVTPATMSFYKSIPNLLNDYNRLSYPTLVLGKKNAEYGDRRHAVG